jgi:hypothetical protein
MTAEHFRALALDMHDAIEGAHMGHPDFRANGRIFATLHPGEVKGMVKLTPDEQQALMRSSPRMFVPSSGAWGRQGCTDVLLAKADQATVRGAMILAWQGATSKPPVRPRAKTPSRRRKTGVTG